MRRRWVVGSVALLAAGAPCLVAAQPPAQPERAAATLVYERRAGADVCPEQRTLEDAVAARLGYFPFRFEAARTVAVRIERWRKGLRADVELRESDGRVSGSRELTTPSADCNELLASLAVAISLGLDPLSLGRPLTPASASSASAPTLPSASASSAVPSASAPPVSSAPPASSVPPVASSPATAGSAGTPRPGVVVPWQLRASLGPAVWSGTAPALAIGLVGAVAVRRGPWSIALEGRNDLTTTVHNGSVSTDSSITTVGVAPCLYRGLVLGCLLGQIGTIQAEGHGLTEPRGDHSLYTAVGARVGLELGLGASLFLRPHLDVLAPLRRSTFFIDGRPIWTSPSLSGAVGLDLGIDFL